MKIFRFTVVIFTISLFSCSQKQGNSVQNIEFQRGDVIFRKGTGVKSQAVLHSDSLSIYSHVGIVVWQDSAFRVVHITPGEREKGETADKIKIESVNDFWRNDRAEHGALYRLKDNSSGDEAARQALRLLEKELLFDHSYQLGDTTEMYCTELVWYAYGQAKKDISFGKRSVLDIPLYAGTYIFPSDIYTNREFVLIYQF